MPRKTKTGRIALDSELCKACYLCISVCPKNLIKTSDTLNQKGYYPAKFTEAENKKKDRKCTGCALCAIICPDIAIEVFRG
jgi:2-oxoglutarate ferredoxin oxidoreductase subunit delta